MCWCTPAMRTPWCGKKNCQPPTWTPAPQKPKEVPVLAAPQRDLAVRMVDNLLAREQARLIASDPGMSPTSALRKAVADVLIQLTENRIVLEGAKVTLEQR